MVVTNAVHASTTSDKIIEFVGARAAFLNAVSNADRDEAVKQAASMIDVKEDIMQVLVADVSAAQSVLQHWDFVQKK